MKAADAAREVLDALGGGPPVVEVLVIDSDSPSVAIASRVIVRAESFEGTLGSSGLDEEAARLGREALRSRQPARSRIELSDGAATIYVQPHFPPEELVIVGAGHIARPLCRIGAMLGYTVTVLDDRPGFATRERFPEAARLLKADFSDPFREVSLGLGTCLVLVTRGHKYDYDALLDVLSRDVELAYIGMVGSQRRVRAALEQLVREGIPRARLSNVYAPIGLDIEAQTPEEIAVSIAAELIRVRRGGTGASMRDEARVVGRFLRG